MKFSEYKIQISCGWGKREILTDFKLETDCNPLELLPLIEARLTGIKNKDAIKRFSLIIEESGG